MRFFGLIIIFLVFTGCVTEYNLATQKEESYLYRYDSDKEIKIGEKISRKIEEKYNVVSLVDLNERVEGILRQNCRCL